jgi:hypothetical protein
VLQFGNASNSWRATQERKPSASLPTLGDEGADDGVVLGGVDGVVAAPVLLRRRRGAAPRRQRRRHVAQPPCSASTSGGVSLGILGHRLRRDPWRKGRKRETLEPERVREEAHGDWRGGVVALAWRRGGRGRREKRGFSGAFPLVQPPLDRWMDGRD